MRLILQSTNNYLVQDTDGLNLGRVFLSGNGYWQSRALTGRDVIGGPGYHADRGYLDPEIAGRALSMFVARGGW